MIKQTEIMKQGNKNLEKIKNISGASEASRRDKEKIEKTTGEPTNKEK